MSQYPLDKPPQSQFPPPAQEGQGYSSNMYDPPAPMGTGQASEYYGQGSTYYGPSGQYMGGPEQGKWQGGGPAGPGMGMAMGQQQGAGGSAYYPGAANVPPTEFMDPTMPRPNDILPLHPAIIQQRQIAASLPPCPKGGYHELRRR
ncbi:hypothetical protein BGZ58_004843 [Dissophora ornata]|nr:hypothetical protein BGZ58_004843 [Dissophora ornata]